MSANVYDVKKVKSIVGGLLMSGFADGDAITVAYNNDKATRFDGNAGDTTFSVNPNGRAGVVTFTTTYGQAINALLYALLLASDELVVVPISITDVNGGAGIFAGACVLKKEPDRAFGAEVGTLEWAFECAEIIKVIGTLVPQGF